jgi:tRNA(fMet)-specific endonuclease VapC
VPCSHRRHVMWGRVTADLRCRGRMIGQNDIMISAIALTLGNCTVVTMDADYSAVPGLAVENWAS